MTTYRTTCDVTVRWPEAAGPMAPTFTIPCGSEVEPVPYNAGLKTPGYALPTKTIVTLIGEYWRFDAGRRYCWIDAANVGAFD